MNNLFKKGCNLINYKTYKGIDSGLLLSGILFGVSNLTLNLSGISNGYFTYVPSLFYLLWAFWHYSDGSRYTKDVNELRNLYNEFIKNYNKMNKDFSNNDPIAIYTMFNFLVKNGYLSKDKNFETNNRCYDLHTLMGLDIINGNGVCRHLAAMLSDILNDYGIPSFNTVCYMPVNNYLVLPTCREKYSRENNHEFIRKYVKSSLERENLLRDLDTLEEYEIYLTFELAPRDKGEKKLEKTGNHLITYSLYNDKSYYMDPTLFEVYRLNNFKNGILNDEYGKEIVIKKDLCYTQNDLTDKEIKMFLKYMENNPSSISMLEEREIVNTVLLMCTNNMDIFDKFYSDNHELYEEIANKLVKVKKKGK